MKRARRAKSMFGIFSRNNDNERGILSSQQQEESITAIIFSINFNALYSELRSFYIKPVLDRNIIELSTNRNLRVRDIFSNSEYINILNENERNSIRDDNTLFNGFLLDFYSREISRYINQSQENDLRYNLLSDAFLLAEHGFILFNDLVLTNTFINNLRKTINDLLADYNDNGVIDDKPTYTAAIGPNTNTIVTANINTAYLIYVQRYGFPIGGVFDNKLLGDIILELFG